MTTTTPDPAQQSVVLDQIDVPEWLLTRPVTLIPRSAADLMAAQPPPGTSPDSAEFEMVVDENGKAILSTVRAISNVAGRGADPSFRAFLTRIAHVLPSARFDPAMIGTCAVRQITLQPFAG